MDIQDGIPGLQKPPNEILKKHTKLATIPRSTLVKSELEFCSLARIATLCMGFVQDEVRNIEREQIVP